MSSMQEPSVALVSPSSEHSFPVTTLQDVFSAKELEELGQSPTARPKDKNRLWSLAAKGVSALGRASGTEMALNKSSDLFEETESVGLTVGRFSVEHTSVTDSR